MSFRADIEAAGQALEQGNFKKALKSAQLAAKKAPKLPIAPNIVGIALSQTGRPKEAIGHFQKALKLDPAFHEARKNLAQTLIVLGRAQTAHDVLGPLAKATPKDPVVWSLMAQAHLGMGQTADALTCADRMIASAPRHGAGYHLRSEVHLGCGRIKDAIRDLEAALHINPQDIKALVDISLPLARQNRSTAALEAVQTAVHLDPANLNARYRLATQLVEMGQTDKAIPHYRAALDIAPTHAPSLERLSEVLAQDDVATLGPAITSALRKAPSGTDSKASLYFAQARIASRTGAAKEARKALQLANAEMAKALPYDAEQDRTMTRRVLARFPDVLTLPTADSTPPEAIFVLGLPRSGTTLAEAVLGAHPDVTPLGERGTMGFLLRDTIETDLAFDADRIAALTKEDRRLLPDLPDTTRAYVDKMPDNYRIVGFLKMAYPACRIIHISRDPRDIALSMWKSQFAGTALSYSYDLAAMAHKFNLYAETMAHWRRVLPGHILDVSYEDMTADITRESRRMAQFCDLDWCDAMARPDQSTAQVLTLSATQLRRPVHSRSVGGWRAEQDLLAPFIKGLDPELWGKWLTPA